MEAVVLNMNNGEIDLSYISVSLRICYMLLNKTALAGNLEMNMILGEDFHNMPLLLKIKLICDYNETTLKGKTNLKNLREIGNNYKQFLNVKHPDLNSIKTFKKFESTINILFVSIQKKLIKSTVASQLTELKYLIEKDKFELYKLDVAHNVGDKIFKELMNPVNLLQFALPDHTKKDMLLVVTEAFLNKDFLENRKIYDYATVNSLSTDQIYLYKCLQFPVPNVLKAIELQYIRNKLTQTVKTFNDAISYWLTGFDETVSIEERNDFFSDEIIPLLSDIQETTDKIDIIQYAYKELKNTSVEVWIGEVPILLIWEYYIYHDCISEAVFNELTESLEINPSLNTQVPLMVISTIGEGRDKIRNITEEEDEEKEVLIRRKSILINE